MLLAEWSGESTIENQQDIKLSLEVCQRDSFPFDIHQGEIRSGGIDLHFWHVNTSLPL